MINSPRHGFPQLIADIGGTDARFGLIDEAGAERSVVLRCADYRSLEEVICAAIVGFRDNSRPRRAALAVAAPVLGDLVALTNLPWTFSIEALRDKLGLVELEVINDFAAVALGVPRLAEHERRQLGAGTAEPDAPIVVLGPGSGLGVATLVRAPSGWLALAGEGGHVTMAPANDREDAILTRLRRNFGHVSAEEVLSGPGLVNLYRAVNDLNGSREMEITTAQITAAEITKAALAGRSSVCVEVLELFAAMLGTVAGNAALTLGGRGGVYIAGGILPRLGDFLDRSAFRRRFTDKGGHAAAYLARIPTYLVTHPLPAFLGLRAQLSLGTAPA
ncbi:MAG: glucokinase [Rhodospirillaceae bacterium]